MVTDCSASWLDGGPIARRPTTSAASFASDEIEVVVTRLDVVPEAVRASAELLSDAERQRASCFVFDRDRRRFTVARARLRRLLSARLGMRPESVELVYGAHGKPALARRCAGSDLRFNVSHSDDVAVYAFSPGREIGIDIESVRVIRDAEDIAVRFFSRRENEAYRALDPRDRPLGFFNCWTRKEAFIKALGGGLSYPLDRFDVSLAPGEPAKILRVESTPGSHSGWTLHSFSPGSRLIGAIVVGKLARELTSKVPPERIAVRWLPLAKSEER
jgi:4'-phosphopantetheinyl transferase